MSTEHKLASTETRPTSTETSPTFAETSPMALAATRRTFLKVSAATTALAFPAASYANILGSNSRLNVAVIGVRSRGQDHIRGFNEQIVALCDCDGKFLEQRATEFKSKYGRQVKQFEDYRELVRSDDIDAVSVATPNHTHSIISIEAVKHGKHVYCEKPVSHNVWEGRQLVNAARKFGRLVQCGTQSRSSSGIKRAVKFVRDGKLGDIQYAIGTCFKPRKSIGKLKDALELPRHLNYDLWCGPAEKRHLMRPQIHYDWHWDFNTGNGDMGNQGIHQMDIARWFLGEQSISPEVISIGDRVGYDDAGDTPNTQTVVHLYEKAPLIFETRGLPTARKYQDARWGSSMDHYRGSRIGVIVQCSEGYVVIPSYSEAIAYDHDGTEIRKWSSSSNHYANFLDAVKADDSSLLNADILEGHLSSSLCHTGGVSHLTGEKRTLDEIRVAANTNKWFAESFERLVEHLVANEVELSGESLTLGGKISFDVKKETVTNNEEANKMMARDYRDNFVVEEIQV